MTLTDWLHVGANFLSHVIHPLKDRAFEKGAIINCDETWCRSKVYDKYKKLYIWCLVNREAKIVLYFYEDGSRGRDALMNILGDAKLKALQSDGYNVYMYLDDTTIDIEHVCCMAHAQAKFRYAEEQGNDPAASYILELIGALYALEETYKEANLNPEEIRKARQGARTLEIMGMLRSKLDALKVIDDPNRGDLMTKAIRYLDTFWTQIFAYRNDGRYSIDNSIAERFIRPLSGERKNSLFFGSDKMAIASATYHTIVSTCRIQGLSALEYLKKSFYAIAEGRRDYANLLPMTIGLSAKEY